MGVYAGITYEKFPKQGENLGSLVEVFFGYDRENTIGGVVVRSDIEEPYQTIIRLDDGRYVLDSECRYQVLDLPEAVDA